MKVTWAALLASCWNHSYCVLSLAWNSPRTPWTSFSEGHRSITEKLWETAFSNITGSGMDPFPLSPKPGPEGSPFLTSGYFDNSLHAFWGLKFFMHDKKWVIVYIWPEVLVALPLITMVPINLSGSMLASRLPNFLLMSPTQIKLSFVLIPFYHEKSFFSLLICPYFSQKTSINLFVENLFLFTRGIWNFYCSYFHSWKPRTSDWAAYLTSIPIVGIWLGETEFHYVV